MSKSNKATKFILWFWGLFVFFIALVCLMFYLIRAGVIGYFPDIEDLKNPSNKNASEIYSSDGVLLGSYFSNTENRVEVTYNDISSNVIHALEATEDVRFRSHSGIDGRGILRAVLKLGKAGGGSTVTQQLAKQLITMDKNRERSNRIVEKLNEWVIAVELERLYTKEEILEMYLNKFDFLYNAVGIKMAAKVYFGSTPDKLKIEEAAVLMGMCKNPSLYNPVRDSLSAVMRRNTVLNQMEKADYLNETECDSLKALPIILKFNKVDHKLGLATYFREYLRQMMMAKKPERDNYASFQGQKFYEDSLQWENNPLFGWCNKNMKSDGKPYNIYTDGLKIYTTIDSRMQQYAENAVYEHIMQYLQPNFYKEKKNKTYAPFSRDLTTEQVKEALNRTKKQSERYTSMKRNGYSEAEIDKVFNEKIKMELLALRKVKDKWQTTLIDTVISPMDSIRYMKYFLRCGFMSMNPHSGHVKAYVGGLDYRFFQYDMVTSGKRQIGSTIKPFLYTLAMRDGATPCEKMKYGPQTLIDENGTPWTPKNADKYKDVNVGDMVSLRWGLSKSNNWVTAAIMKEKAPGALVNIMHNSFGITSKLDPVVALALGPSEISLAEMVEAYTVFINKGMRTSPVFVTKIEDRNGNVISGNLTPLPKQNTSEGIGPETSYKMLDMLQAVTKGGGTAVRLRYRYNFTAEIGGKTGTTQNNSDGWFMGFTPNLVSGVWVGGEERAIHFDNMTLGQGAEVALPIWALYMKNVFENSEKFRTKPKEAIDLEDYSQNAKFDIPAGFNACKSNSSEDENTRVIEEVFGEF